MRIFKLLSLSLILFLLLACSSEKSPDQVYEEYNSRVIKGINYDGDMAYYTKRKQEEVESKIPQYMEMMEKPRDEVIKVYIEVSRELAKCKEITLVKEVVDLNTAVLEYSQKDICGNEPTSQEKQTIQMINEGGWKIDDIEISL
jgi:hypothetical protein